MPYANTLENIEVLSNKYENIRSSKDLTPEQIRLLNTYRDLLLEAKTRLLLQKSHNSSIRISTRGLSSSSSPRTQEDSSSIITSSTPSTHHQSTITTLSNIGNSTQSSFSRNKTKILSSFNFPPVITFKTPNTTATNLSSSTIIPSIVVTTTYLPSINRERTKSSVPCKSISSMKAPFSTTSIYPFFSSIKNLTTTIPTLSPKSVSNSSTIDFPSSNVTVNPPVVYSYNSTSKSIIETNIPSSRTTISSEEEKPVLDSELKRSLSSLDNPPPLKKVIPYISYGNIEHEYDYDKDIGDDGFPVLKDPNHTEEDHTGTILGYFSPTTNSPMIIRVVDESATIPEGQNQVLGNSSQLSSSVLPSSIEKNRLIVLPLLLGSVFIIGGFLTFLIYRFNISPNVNFVRRPTSYAEDIRRRRSCRRRLSIGARSEFLSFINTDLAGHEARSNPHPPELLRLHPFPSEDGMETH